MRVVALARTLGVGSFAGLSAGSAQMGKALGGALGSSQASFQHTKVQVNGINPESGDGPSDIPDPFDLEFDRFNGGAMADAEAGNPRPYNPPPPVDLEYELDRDDPEGVDIEALYESPDEDEEIFLAGKDVDLDDEYDLMHDHALGVTEPSPGEPKTGSSPNPEGFEAMKNAATGAAPKPGSGA